MRQKRGERPVKPSGRAPPRQRLRQQLPSALAFYALAGAHPPVLEPVVPRAMRPQPPRRLRRHRRCHGLRLARPIPSPTGAADPAPRAPGIESEKLRARARGAIAPPTHAPPASAGPSTWASCNASSTPNRAASASASSLSRGSPRRAPAALHRPCPATRRGRRICRLMGGTIPRGVLPMHAASRTLAPGGPSTPSASVPAVR